MEIAQWTRVLGRYAERLHAQAGHGHHVVSPLGEDAPSSVGFG
jgi:hypothetical protein